LAKGEREEGGGLHSFFHFAAHTHAMEAAAYKRLYPHEYYAKFIAEDARPDGRPLGRARPMSVAKGVVTTANGSALVKVGRTSVLAAVKLEPVAPELDTPGEGMLEVNVELPPMCSAATRPGRCVSIASLA
jgi:exosome complex component RRP43